MSTSNEAQVADLLATPRLANRGQVALPASLAPKTLEEGYRVQAGLVARLLAARGGRAIGYKIACSNKLAQDLLNVDAPLFGTLMSATSYASPAKLKGSDYNVRCMEAEFGFELATDVPAGNHDAQSIRPYVKCAFACLEIVNHHHQDWTRLGAPLLVADNAIHGAWVTGAPSDAWRDIDLAKQAVTLYAEGRVVQTGSGAAVLGNPLNALAWLANELPRHGRQLKAGDRVSSGVATDVYFAKPVERVEADFGAIGRVAIDFV